jgi:hypothetical protein
LWPETLLAGVFEEHCWLKVAGKSQVQVLRHEGAQSALNALGRLLAASAAAHRLRPRMLVTLGDAFVQLVALPWQEQLNGSVEVVRYARLMMERAGRNLDETCVVQADFAHHAAMGLAYALPVDWLRDLLDLAQQHGVLLQRVQPASAAAYYRPACAVAGQEALLLCETGRITGLLRVSGKLKTMDAEPATVDPAKAAVRLLRRLQLRHGAIAAVSHWSAIPECREDIADAVAREVPDAVHMQIETEGLA